jgi:hypothetical protein
MPATAAAFDLSRLPGLLGADPAHIARARRRQADVFAGRRPDAWPLLLNAGLTPAQEAIPSPNLAEAFADADLMLCQQVRGACGVVNAGADGVPSMRVNFGTGVLLSCFGLEQEVFPDKMPWLRRHLTREQVARIEPDQLRPAGAFERGLEFMSRMRAAMGDSLSLYCMDTQGPLDLAHLLLGDDFFYLLYDDPPLAHHALRLCVELSTRAHRWMKERFAEPAGAMHHSNMLYAENMGIRICEDTTAILGEGLIREFAMPYTQELARRFGGAWVHYCGRSDHLTRALCELPEIGALNFGHVPGHEHDHPFEEDLAHIAQAGKVYIGDWPRRPGEDAPAYLRRLHRWAHQGALIPSGNAALYGDGAFASPRDLLRFWRELG